MSEGYINDCHKKATEFFNEEKYDDAIIEYRKILEKDPNDTSAMYYLGYAYIQKNNVVQALHYYDILVKKQPYNYKAYFFRGYIYEKHLLKPELAIKEFITAIKLNPHDSENHLRLGYCYEDLKQYDDAFNEAQKAIDCNMLDPYNFLLRAKMLMLKCDYESAFNDVKTAVSFTFPDIVFHKSVFLCERGNNEKLNESARLLLKEGFYLEKIGNEKTGFILYPRGCSERLIIRMNKIHIGRNVRKYIRKNKGKLELKIDYDINEILECCMRHHTDLYMKNSSYLYAVLNKCNKHPRFIGIGLLKDGELVSGNIGVEYPEEGVYTGYTGFYRESNARKALIALYVEHCKREGYSIYDMGPRCSSKIDEWKWNMNAEIISDMVYRKKFKEKDYGSC